MENHISGVQTRMPDVNRQVASTGIYVPGVKTKVEVAPVNTKVTGKEYNDVNIQESPVNTQIAVMAIELSSCQVTGHHSGVR